MKRTLSGLLSLLIVLTLFTPFSIVFAEEDAATSGIVYYVDAEDGDDNNPGTSPEQAWKSLTKVTATTFQPGDQILLKSGSVWNGEWLWPKGSGVEGAPIKIDKYGGEALPVINGMGVDRGFNYSGAVHLRNQEYWEIRNLEITNDDDFDTDIVLQRPQGDNSYPNKDKTRNGILLIVDGDLLEDDADGIMDHIYIENCYIHDVDGPNDWNDTFTGGIIFNVIGSTIRPNTSFRDLRIANNTIRKVDLLGITGYVDMVRGNYQAAIGPNNLWMRDIYIGHNYMEDIGQGGMALALSLCLAMFAGCGGTPSSSSTVSSGPSSSSEDTSTSGFENKELNIAIFEGGYGPEYWEEIVDRFEETYGVTVNMVHHALYQKQNYSYAGVIEALSGAPFDVRFISFDDLRADAHVLDGVDVLINVGDGDTAHTGGREWEDPAVAAAVRGFVYNGGGLIGVGEPAGHQYEGHYLQLAGVLGVEKETGFTLGYDKYNWDEHPGHFILQDCTKPVDFGEGKKSIYALPGTEILVQREKEVQMAVHAFGRGRAVYISGLPYSFENSRVLYRSILWSAHDEESLHKWFSSNFNVEVHAYVKNGKYCVVNNTYEPQSTVVYKGDGSSFALDMAANEIKWYEI